MGVSIRSYARQRGVSHVAVLRAARWGRIPLEADGTVDPVKADAAWARESDPARATAKPKGLKPVAENVVSSVRETLKEQGLPAGGNITFVQARTAHEIAKAHLAKAQALVFRLAREERDAVRRRYVDEITSRDRALIRSRVHLRNVRLTFS